MIFFLAATSGMCCAHSSAGLVGWESALHSQSGSWLVVLLGPVLPFWLVCSDGKGHEGFDSPNLHREVAVIITC